MKKSVVVVLIIVALVILVSPGIVGRLAQRSMEVGLDRAASETTDVRITAERYERGWFSSEGQHRLEIRPGKLRDLLVAIVGPENPEELPALIIDTRLDHGLIPVTSMGREKGTLTPGLGNAVSTLRIEFPGGETVAVPGSVYSSISVVGDVESSYALEPGSYSTEGGELRWGRGGIVVTSSPATGRLAVSAELDPITAESTGEALRLGAAKIEMSLMPSRFGFPVGRLGFAAESLSVGSPSAPSIGPLSFHASSRVQDERLSANGDLRIANAPIQPFGSTGISVEFRVAGADGAAFARLQRAVDDVLVAADPALAEKLLEADVQRLLAAGIELHIDRLAVELPEGTITARSAILVDESTSTAWPALLLALDATLDVRLPAAVFDRLATLRPDLRTLATLGYLERHADDYLIETAINDGRLTINGAPVQLPLGAFR